MPWLLLALLCIFSWGLTDILYKKSLPYNDPFSHYKCLVWNGIAMAVAGTILAFFSDTLGDSFKNVLDNLYLIPVALLYPLALFFGLKGKQHLDVSVVSPLENVDGALAAVLLYSYFIVSRNSQVTNGIGPMDFLGTALIVLGIIALGIYEHRLAKAEAGLAREQKKHRFGALVLLFPMVYNMVDAVSMVMTGITVHETTADGISDIDFFIFESLAFAVIGIVMWLYLLIAKKYLYNPFKKESVPKLGAASFETMGTMLFIFATAMNPVLTAPITSSYCIVSILVAHILLKERLTKKQYIYVALLVVGIALLGLSELLRS